MSVPQPLGALRAIGVAPTISYSLLAAMVRQQSLEQAVAEMAEAGVGAVHFDTADEVVTLPASLSADLRDSTSLPFDYHVAMRFPEETLAQLALRAGDYVCAHVESTINWLSLQQLSKDAKAAFGAGLNVNTSVEALYPVIETHSPAYVLVMAAEAGRSGGAFSYETLDKVYALRSRYPTLRIHVDGGVNHLAATALRGLEVDLLVSGSFLHSGTDPQSNLAFLKGIRENPRLIELLGPQPPLVEVDASWQTVIEAVLSGGMGAVAVVEDGAFRGLITNSDLVKFVSSTEQDLFSAMALNIANRTPFCAHSDEYFSTLIVRMQSRGLMHTVVPLMDREGNFEGLLRTQDILFSHQGSGR